MEAKRTLTVDTDKLMLLSNELKGLVQVSMLERKAMERAAKKTEEEQISVKMVASATKSSDQSFKKMASEGDTKVAMMKAAAASCATCHVCKAMKVARKEAIKKASGDDAKNPAEVIKGGAFVGTPCPQCKKTDDPEESKKRRTRLTVDIKEMHRLMRLVPYFPRSPSFHVHVSSLTSTCI